MQFEKDLEEKPNAEFEKDLEEKPSAEGKTEIMMMDELLLTDHK